MEPKLTENEKKAVNDLPGVAADAAVAADKVTEKEVKDYTKELNFNPHSDGI